MRSDRLVFFVMPGLVPGINVLDAESDKYLRRGWRDKPRAQLRALGKRLVVGVMAAGAA